MSLRFIFLTQYYPPEPGAASLRLAAMARELVRHGHGVTVVSAMPHHLGTGAGKSRKPLWLREQVDGIPVIRTWIWRVKTGRLWRRLLNYFSFVVTSMVGLWQAGTADFLLIESPPLFLGITGFVFSRLRGMPYIFSVSDLWPESAVALGLVRNRTMIRWARWLECFLYRHAAFVSSVTEGIRQGVIASGTIPAERVLFFPNGVDLELFHPTAEDPELRQKLGLLDKKVFLYPGTIGYAQGLEVMIEAADFLRDQTDIAFLLVGEGPMKRSLEEKARQRGLKNVIFEELQPASRMSLYFAMARAVVVPLRNHPLFRGARPSKVFPAFAARVPVIFVGEGEMQDLIEDSGGGMVVPPEDGGGLAMAVEFLARIQDFEWEQMANAGYGYVRQHYRWDHLADQWLSQLT